MLEDLFLRDYYYGDILRVEPFKECTSTPNEPEDAHVTNTTFEEPEDAHITNITFEETVVGHGIFEKRENVYRNIETGIDYFYNNDVAFLTKEYILVGSLKPIGKHLKDVNRKQKIEILSNIKSYKKNSKNMVK